MKGLHNILTLRRIPCLLIILLSGFFLYACNGGDGDGGVIKNSLTIKMQGTTEDPNIIKLNFSVETDTGEPVANLPVGTAGFFTVTDDDEALVDTEASYVAYQAPRNANDYSLYTIVMVDLSGTVVANSALTGKIKTNLKAFIDKILANNQKVALYVFDSGIQMATDFTNDQSVLEATINDLFVPDQLNTHRGTSSNMYGAIVNGLNVLDGVIDDKNTTYATASLVVFSDGVDTTNLYTYKEALLRVQNNNHPVFLTIYADPGLQETNRLEPLASTYYTLLNTMDIDAVNDQFKTIETNLKNEAYKFYILEYATPKRDRSPNVSHTLDVQFTYGKYQTSELTYSYNAYNFTKGGYIQIEDKKLALYDKDDDRYYSVDGVDHDCDDANPAIWKDCPLD